MVVIASKGDESAPSRFFNHLGDFRDDAQLSNCGRQLESERNPLLPIETVLALIAQFKCNAPTCGRMHGRTRSAEVPPGQSFFCKCVIL